MSADPNNSVIGAVLSGRDPGWVRRECCECGMPARFPEGLVAGTEFESVPAICDDCEVKSRDRAYSEAHEPDVDRLIDRSNVPAIAPVDRMHPAFSAMAEGRRHGLFVVGEPGVGKTRNACAMVRRWCERGHRAFYLREKEYFSAAYKGDKSVTKRAEKTPLLVIDDLGKTTRATGPPGSSSFSLTSGTRISAGRYSSPSIPRRPSTATNIRISTRRPCVGSPACVTSPCT